MVIQRWQSLFLLLAAALMVCFTFVSLGQLQTPDFTYKFTSLGFSYVGEATDGAPGGMAYPTIYLFIISLTAALLLLLDIFLYKNLVLQKKIAIISALLSAASIVCAYVVGSNAEGEMQWYPSMIYVCPELAVILALMAWNRMQSDHNKLKAVDRIR